jgi:hypothetical protein
VKETNMNSIIRASLLASIQTMRTILLGIEAMLRQDYTENNNVVRLKNVVTPDEEVDDIDLQALGRTLGLVGDGGRNVED